MPEVLEADILRALTALSAPECSRCARPLKPGQTECCNRVYCPICRREQSEGSCAHVVAFRRHGRWTLPSVIAVNATVETLPVDEDSLIEWSDAQKEAALGIACPVAHRIWGEGMAVAPSRWHVRESIVRAVPGTVVASCNVGGRNHLYAFHPDPEEFVRQGRALIDAWKKGFETMKHTTADAARHLIFHRRLDPFGGGSWNDLGGYTQHHRALFLTFSANGARLAVGLHGRIEMREVATGDRLWSWQPTAGAPRSAVFTPDGATLAVMMSRADRYPWEKGPSVMLWETVLLDAATGAVRATLPASGTTGHQTVGSGTLACLHGGRLLADVEGRNVRLTTLGADGSVASTELLTHRVPVKCFGASPDGVSFATIAQSTLLLWRIPEPAQA